MRPPADPSQRARGRRGRRHLVFLRPAVLLFSKLQLLVALLDEEFALEEFETFVDDAGSMSATVLSVNLANCMGVTYMIGALMAMTAFHSFPSSGMTLKSPCKNGT
jgi:hypothetical protein